MKSEQLTFRRSQCFYFWKEVLQKMMIFLYTFSFESVYELFYRGKHSSTSRGIPPLSSRQSHFSFIPGSLFYFSGLFPLVRAFSFRSLCLVSPPPLQHSPLHVELPPPSNCDESVLTLREPRFILRTYSTVLYIRGGNHFCIPPLA